MRTELDVIRYLYNTGLITKEYFMHRYAELLSQVMV